MHRDATGSIIDNEINAQTYRLASALKETNPLAYEMVERERTLHPYSFQVWEFLSLWKHNCNLEQHVDVIIPLLFFKNTKNHYEKKKDAAYEKMMWHIFYSAHRWNS